MGGGVDVFVTDHLALSTDVAYVIPGGDVADTDFLSLGIGLLYLF